MTRKMEFRDVVGEFEVLNIEIGVVLGDALEKINGPLARNIVRDGDVFNRHSFQDRGKDVIRADVAIPFSASEVR